MIFLDFILGKLIEVAIYGKPDDVLPGAIIPLCQVHEAVKAHS
jgi:hypothetical protein